MSDERGRGPAAEMPDAAPAVAPGVEGAAPVERAGEFERYALVAALTLVVLCLLVWDRSHGDASPASGMPPADRTLRVEIGGDAPPRLPGDGPRARADDRVEPGPEKRTAPADVAPVAPPPPAPAPRTYTVRAGETLSAIAQRELGSASRVAEISALNGISDPAKVRAGQVLRLPPR